MFQPTPVVPIFIGPAWFSIFDAEFIKDGDRLLQTREGHDVIYAPRNGREELNGELEILYQGHQIEYLDIIEIGVDGAAGLIRDDVVKAEMLAKSYVEKYGEVIIPAAILFREKKYDLRISLVADRAYVSDFVYLCRRDDGSEVAFELGH